MADSGNNRVRRVDSVSGIIVTIAGNGTGGFSGDGGPANAAQLNFPWLAAVAGTGDLYISDTFNNRVRAVPCPANPTPTPAAPISVAMRGAPKAGSVDILQGKPMLVAPNPAHEAVLVAYRLDKPSKVRVEIFDLAGHGIMSSDQGEQSSGQHSFTMNLSGLASGIYFAVLEVDEGIGFHGKVTFKFSLIRP